MKRSIIVHGVCWVALATLGSIWPQLTLSAEHHARLTIGLSALWMWGWGQTSGLYCTLERLGWRAFTSQYIIGGIAVVGWGAVDLAELSRAQGSIHMIKFEPIRDHSLPDSIHQLTRVTLCVQPTSVSSLLLTDWGVRRSSSIDQVLAAVNTQCLTRDQTLHLGRSFEKTAIRIESPHTLIMGRAFIRWIMGIFVAFWLSLGYLPRVSLVIISAFISAFEILL